jgi:hypothetical protein
MLIARVLRRYSILSTALLLAWCTVAGPAYAQLQGIGLAGACAINYGQQSQTSQTTPDIVSGTDSVTLGVGTPTSKLKLGVVESEKPASVTVRFPAPVYRDLEAYSEAHPKETLQPKSMSRS